MMNKYEFLIRFSTFKHKKPTQIRRHFHAYSHNNNVESSLLLQRLGFTAEDINQFNRYDIKQTLSWIDKENHFLLGFDDPFYPDLLRQISCFPLLIFGIGNLELLITTQIAMVGSREFSDYGAQWGRYFASELAINDLTITSGLALGIDAICHRGALDVSGKTIAVLGSGLCHITPKTNYNLATDILTNNGLIISEFLPYEQAKPQYYPRRNRIISGLSLGTFVVEASRHSGSLITARYALEQNRDVFALPGEINNDNCNGTHWLIQQGAYLVTKPIDILEHYSEHISRIKSQPLPMNDLIYPDILAALSSQAIPIDIIAEKTQMSVVEISIKLVELELEGLVKMANGGYIRSHY